MNEEIIRRLARDSATNICKAGLDPKPEEVAAILYSFAQRIFDEDEQRLITYALGFASSNVDNEMLEDLGLDEVDDKEWDMEDDVLYDELMEARKEQVEKDFIRLSLFFDPQP